MTESKPAGMHPPRKKKPLRLAVHWQAGILPAAGSLAVILLAALLLGLLFSGIISSESSLLKTIFSFFSLLILLLLFGHEGLRGGLRDAMVSRRVRRLEKDGYAPSRQEDASCWHPAKALFAAALVFLVPLLLSAVIALTAEPYHYTLQDLPQWLTAYSSREDIMSPLAAYTETTAPSLRVWLRLLVRLLEMPALGFFRDPQRSAELIDRLAPLVLCLYPLFYLAGYFLGPSVESRIAAKERRAKKAAVRKAERHSLAEELTRGGGEVHYGQRNDDGKRAPKKLI